MSPEDIESMLELSPTRSHKTGEPISSRINSPKSKNNYFSIQSETKSTEGMEKHIEEILTLLEPKLEALRHLSTKAELCLFCGFSSGNGQGGFGLSPQLLSRLSTLGLEVFLDLYPPEEVAI